MEVNESGFTLVLLTAPQFIILILDTGFAFVNLVMLGTHVCALVFLFMYNSHSEVLQNFGRFYFISFTIGDNESSYSTMS